MPSVRSGAPAPDEPVQLSLLQGFPAPAPRRGRTSRRSLPVARVLLESSLPHLDRPFDYSVPADLDAAAQPGVRVKVRFNGQELTRLSSWNAGRLRRRPHPAAAGTRWSPRSPCSPRPSRELADRVAARYAGTVSDVLRVAVPPRMAKLEKEFARRPARSGPVPTAPVSPPGRAACSPAVARRHGAGASAGRPTTTARPSCSTWARADRPAPC